MVKRVRELTNGRGADIVVETANSPVTAPLAVDMAAARGQVVLFGLYPEATISPLTFLRNGLTMCGDVGVIPSYFPRAIR